MTDNTEKLEVMQAPAVGGGAVLEALAHAALEIGTFAGHDQDCSLGEWGDGSKPCTCGYTKASDRVLELVEQVAAALAQPTPPSRGEENQEVSPSREPALAASGRNACDGFDLLRAEFAKPQFMTTTGSQTEDGRQRFTVEFTFVGDGSRNSAYDLQEAFMVAGRAVNAAPKSSVENGNNFSEPDAPA